MKENKGEKIEEASSLGTIKINNEVLATISGRAAAEVKGVAGMSGGVVDGLAKMLGRKNIEKGVKVEIDNDEVNIDISILVDYGASIPTVCSQIQNSVKEKVEKMAGKHVNTVDVNVHGIHFQHTEEKTEEEI